VYLISRRVEGARVFKSRASRPTRLQSRKPKQMMNVRLSRYHTSPANPVRDPAHPELAATNLELSTDGLLLKLFGGGARGRLLD